MYKTISEAIELANGLKRELFELNSQNIEVVLCPPYTALSEVSEVILNSSLFLGAQDVYWEEEGAFTGEISPKMLKDVGVKFVIIGHSERRQFFAETNETVNNKIKAALKYDLAPILCIGETLSQRETNKTFDVLKDHLTGGLNNFTPDQISKIIIAYEPVWAIGTGKTATPSQAQEAHKFIRKLISEIAGEKIASDVRIQYGGSVKPENIEELMRQPDIDGALVGGASLSVASFSTIVKKAGEIIK